MLMSLSSTNSTVCSGVRSRLTDKFKVRSGLLRNGESGVSSLEASIFSRIIGSDLIVVGLEADGSLMWSFESSTSARRMLAANLLVTSGDCKISESHLIMRGLGVVGVRVREK